MTKRKGRQGGRPLSTRNSMHLVLRSSKATGENSLKAFKNSSQIQKIINKFSHKYGVRILSLANAGTHLHLHIKLINRTSYIRFIRAVTAAIAMHVAQKNRWTQQKKNEKFWDYRPFTRIVGGGRAFLTLQDYIQINHLEGLGLTRLQARWQLARLKNSS